MLAPEQKRALFPKLAHWRAKQMMRQSSEAVGAVVNGMLQFMLSFWAPFKK